jgi:osmotically-inducible protein OsmY
VVSAVVAIVMVIGLGYLLFEQGWTGTASRASAVATAVRDTTSAVRHVSSDAAITAKARTALALSKQAPAFDVDVDTVDAVATLTGRVATPESKVQAGQIVANTSGVREVRNLLTIDPTVSPEQARERLVRRVDDLETQTGIVDALMDSPALDGAKIRVRVRDGMVTLDGTVTSPMQKLDAEARTRAFPGVQGLNNQLKYQRDAVELLSEP